MNVCGVARCRTTTTITRPERSNDLSNKFPKGGPELFVNRQAGGNDRDQCVDIRPHFSLGKSHYMPRSQYNSYKKTSTRLPYREFGLYMYCILTTFVMIEKPPSANIPATATFVRFGICSVNTVRIGRQSMNVSIRTSATPSPRNMTLKLKHFPGLVRCQNASTGRQVRRLEICAATNQSADKDIATREAWR